MTMTRKRAEYVRTDWSDPKSIRDSERKQRRLENAGYRLVHTRRGLFYSLSTYHPPTN